ncbi:nuclear protein [Irineochytrium annulatum]|nr:nuclear protein [Irineochytrium annulatum]
MPKERPAKATSDETREIRREYRNLHAEVEAKKHEWINPSSNALDEAVTKSNSLFMNVRSTQEASLDSKFLIAAADIGVQKAARLKLSGNIIEVEDFINKAVIRMGGQRGGGRRNDDDDGRGRLDWHALGEVASRLGPLAVEPKVRKEKKASTRLVKDKKNLTKPQELKESDIEKKTNETSKIIKNIKNLIEVTGRVSLFEFIMNPESFGQSVENLFYVAFLVKDGIVAVEMDDDNPGVPYISPVSAEGDEESGEVKKRQLVVGLTHQDWKVGPE